MKGLKATITLLYCIAAIWIVFGIMWLFLGSDYRWLYATGAFGNAVLLAILTRLMSRGRRWAYWLLVIMMTFNVLVVIFDQFGWFDLAYLVPAMLAFIMLLLINKENVQRNT